MASSVLRQTSSTSSLERPTSYSKAVNGNSENEDVLPSSSRLVHLSCNPSYDDFGFNEQTYQKGEQIQCFHGKEQLNRRESESSCSSLQSLACTLCGSFSSHSNLLSNHKGNASKMITVLLVVMVLLNIMLLSLPIALFILAGNLQIALDEETDYRQQNSNTFCLPCNDLHLGPLKEDNLGLKLLMHKTENGKEICCAKGENQNSIVMQLLFKRREKLEQVEGCPCNSSGISSGDSQKPGPHVSAHLVVGLYIKSSGETPFTLTNWIGDGALAHSDGVEVQNNRMIINSPGNYHLYSQVLFNNLYKGHSPTNISQTLYHYVYRWNIKYPNDGTEMLLKSIRTQCWAENKLYGDYTSYTSGVFKLNTGDNVYVQVSNIDLVSRDHRTTFVGLAKL